MLSTDYFPPNTNYSNLLRKHYVDPTYYDNLGEGLDSRDVLFGDIRVINDYFDIHYPVGHTEHIWGWEVQEPGLILGAKIWPAITSTCPTGSPYMYLMGYDKFLGSMIELITGGISTNNYWEYSSMSKISIKPFYVEPPFCFGMTNTNSTNILEDGRLAYTVLFASVR